MESFKLNQNLIDSNFDGYKLSLDSLPIYQFSFDNNLDFVRLTDDQYSYQHLKSFGNHNHLFRDPWNPETTWFIDEHWHVQQAGSFSETNKISVTSCYTIAGASERCMTANRVNSTIQFTSVDWAVIADGTGWIYILQTGDRSHSPHNWKLGYAGQPLGSKVHFAVLHSVLHSDEQTRYVEAICVHIDVNPVSDMDNHAPVFVTKLEWFSFTSDNNSTFTLSRTRRLESFCSPDYVAIHPQGTSLILACEKPVKFVHDSLKPVAEGKVNIPEGLTGNQDLSACAYTWSQTDTIVMAQFHLSPKIVKADILFSLTSGHIEIKTERDENVLITGDLCGPVNITDSTWILDDNNVLELRLCKSETLNWSSLVPSDSRGERVFTDEQILQINHQLTRYTSDSVVDHVIGDKRISFNTREELEECDKTTEEDAAIWYIDGETHEVIHQVNISSHQWLFSGISSTDQLPVMCLRHDVDGIIWQPSINKPSTDPLEDDSSITWLHVATFNAFGYVQASKQNRKFITCAPDFSYAIIANCSRHIFVYRQPAEMTSPVRNRKTGEQIGSVAKQQLISLELADNIVGVHATERRIYVLSGRTLYAVTVKE